MFFAQGQKAFQLSAKATRRGRRPGSSRASGFRPSLERLEDRTVLSTFMVANLNDSGGGSLRQALADANASPGRDTINFAPGLTGAGGRVRSCPLFFGP